MFSSNQKSRVTRRETVFVLFSAALLGATIFNNNTLTLPLYTYVKEKSIILPSGVRTLSYSPNGDFLAVVYSADRDADMKDEEGGVAIIATESGNIIETLDGHRLWEATAAWRPQGDILATASRDRTVRLWNTSSWKTEKIFEVPYNAPFDSGDVALAWSPDGEKFAVSINDQAIFIYSLSNGTIISTLIGGPRNIVTLSWSPDGKYLASGGWTYTVNIWNAQSFELVKKLEAVSVRTLEWSPDGRFLATASHGSGGELVIWDSTSWKPIATRHLGFGISLSWSPDGAKLAAADWGRTIFIWSATTWNVTNTIIDTYGILSVQWNPKGNELASGMYGMPRGQMVSIWREEIATEK
jgi:WD40 repeat protein